MVMRHEPRRALLLCALLSSALATLPASAAEIRGIVSANAKQRVAWANVSVVGSRLGAITDEKGRFRISGVPAGVRILHIESLEFPAFDDTVMVAEGKTRELKIAMNLWSPKPPPPNQRFEARVGADCGSPPARDRAGIRRESATNLAGESSVEIDTRAPWEFVVRYQLNKPGTPIVIEVVDSSGKAVRQLAKGLGKRSAELSWDGRTDAGYDLPPGNYRFRFVTTAGTVELGGCLRAIFYPVRVKS